MTNPNLTEIICILDRSGSMRPLVDDTIGGFNAFIKEQAKLDGECRVTMVQFDHTRKVHYSAKPIEDVGELVYRPGGSTALLDALGVTIDEVGARLKETPETERPAKVIVMVMTDGAENSSTRFTLSDVAAKVAHQERKYGWEFVFLGANMDAFETGSSIGVSKDMASNFTPDSRGVRDGFSRMNRYAKSSRAGRTPDKVSAELTDDDRIS